MSIKLRQLRCFIVLAEERNYRRAAERLYMTQPPLTRQIRLLEELFGVALFERDRQGVSLTPEGESLLPEARDLVARADRLVEHFHDKVGGKACVRLGVTPAVSAGWFAGIDAKIQECMPSVKVETSRQPSIQSVRDLPRGRLDIAVIGALQPAADLIMEPLFCDPLVVCLPATHALSRRHQVSLSDIGQDALFWFDRRMNPAYHDQCQKVFDRLGFSPKRIREPPDHHVLLSLIAEGKGVALMPGSLQTISHPGVIFRKLAEGPELGVQVSVACTAKAPARVRQLMKLLGEHVQQLRPGTSVNQ